ncbi:uncharacterized protein LOC116916820 isoform X2 [Daphnia magna]|uniref:uncharacterized protein LOC116916820 isoform X2 n=1 Tax=Daphnia magna TaxID=35525 RepID=UPI001E1BB41E|nr:uncharacterized protein LOC116916820 isoform X2 [Daphnia magna]XP_045025987.1 uncharacterized protein LOC116916820 isoform X2 [Daphnia magna]XP_045025988.1 uncharacterized protein LOC116916820 isoform X2 [Daphnia magna]
MCSHISQPQSLHLLCVANRQPSASQVSRFPSSAKNHPYTSALNFGLQMFILLPYNTAVSTISVVSPPVDHTQVHFLRLPVIVYAFTSSLSSLTSSPSSPSRRLVVVVFVAFISVSSSSSWPSSPSSPSRRRRLGRPSSPSSPSRRRLGRFCCLCLPHHLVAGFAFALHVGSSAWIVALVSFYFAL